MATANTIQKKPCSKCDKGSGIFTCDGCQQSFCRKHSDEHRQELATLMDNVGQEHDVLQRDINREAGVHPLLSRIDAWERESIDKIQQVANQARVDLNQLINQKKQELKTTMTKLTNELQSSRESEDYTELDLKKWIDQLNDFRQDLAQSINTYLIEEEDQRSVIRLIKVKNANQSLFSSAFQSIRKYDQNIRNNQYASLVNGERFGKGDKEIELLEDDSVAMYSGAKLRRSAIIFGTNLYSVDRHFIHFQVEKRTDDNIFIGIVTLSQTDPSSVFSTTTTVNGWWRCDYSIVYNVAEKASQHSEMLEGDRLTLTIDCDQKRIHLEHHRRKRILQLSIDTQKCPFPWKSVVGLGPGSGIRILH
jgi:hypothetical protein